VAVSLVLVAMMLGMPGGHRSCWPFSLSGSWTTVLLSGKGPDFKVLVVVSICYILVAGCDDEVGQSL
jgi:hypothetical protein